MENVRTQHITKAPGVCGGRACIAGHRVRVQDVVVLHQMRGMAAKEIAAEYPGISLADIHAALAYYDDHVEEIEEGFREDRQWARWAEHNLPSRLPPECKEKFGG